MDIIKRLSEFARNAASTSPEISGDSISPFIIFDPDRSIMFLVTLPKHRGANAEYKGYQLLNDGSIHELPRMRVAAGLTGMIQNGLKTFLSGIDKYVKKE